MTRALPRAPEAEPRRLSDPPGVRSFEALHRWKAYLELTCSPKTRREYLRTVVNFMADTLRHDLGAITEDDVVDYLGRFPAKGGMRGAILRAFRSLYGWGVPRGIFKRNPVGGLTLPRPKYPPPPRLTDGELTRLVLAAAARRPHDPRRPWAILLCYGTATRVGSLCAVGPEDVRLNGSHSRITFREAKGDDPYALPLEGVARQAAQELLALIDWTAKRGRRRPTLIGVGPTQFWSWVREAGEMAGVHSWPHLLRHTAATVASERGVDVTVISRMLNHKDLRSTQRYVGVSDPRLRRAMEAR